MKLKITSQRLSAESNQLAGETANGNHSSSYGRMCRKAFQASLLAFAMATPVFAEDGNETPDPTLVRGQITDVDHRALPGASIMIEGLGTRVVSDDEAGSSVRLILLDTTPLIDSYRRNSGKYHDAGLQDACRQAARPTMWSTPRPRSCARCSLQTVPSFARPKPASAWSRPTPNH